MTVEAMKQALEVLERLHGGCTDSDDGTVEAITIWCPDVITTLRAAIEQAEKPRQWKSLTDEEIQTAWASMNHDPAAFVHFAGGALWAEAKCKEKNR